MEEKKKNKLKNFLGNLEILLGIVSGVFFYLDKQKEIKIFQYLSFLSALCLGIVYYIDKYKFSEKTEMTSYHEFRVIVMIFISILMLIFMIVNP